MLRTKRFSSNTMRVCLVHFHILVAYNAEHIHTQKKISHSGYSYVLHYVHFFFFHLVLSEKQNRKENEKIIHTTRHILSCCRCLIAKFQHKESD